MNTQQKGAVRYIVFKDGDTWYAAGLEFNIVECGEDPRVALNNLFDAMTGYVASYRKVKGVRLDALNQKTDPEYERLWSIVTAPKKTKSPYQVNTFGIVKV